MAVRNTILAALQKGDAQDPAFRETVYRQVFAAFERSVATKSNLSVDEVYRRREFVISVIREIEQEFAVGMSEPDPYIEPSAPEPQFPDHADSLDFSPDRGRNDVRMQDAFPQMDEQHELVAAASPRGEAREPSRKKSKDKSPKGRRGRGFLLFLILALAALAILVGSIWYALRNGAPARVIDEIGEIISSTTGGAATGALVPQADADWIKVITPDDATTVRAADGATVELMTESDMAFYRIGGMGSNAAVVFEVGQGALEHLVGKTAVFSIHARAGEGEETQMSVTCDFGDLGKCGRMRYTVDPVRSEYLFRVNLADIAPRGGTITIVPDIENRGRLLDILSIRATTE